ncbi:ATP-binding cassette, subfamily B [Eubacterium uniforme]|uniref:ATP-binding cassette, subfamily B n=1 Tax=Eubacterium uniforme TaxID=39495 RepID=A0A1T4VMF7_9FIRM|nr:ABC transporter ATP-binding protein [Eubacterium uniforme]SKA66119.1 ATP-binding cassette, subfamily B [Eubacterium uniforme]
MKENKLNEKALMQLDGFGIREEDVLSVCPIDLSFDGEYILGYVFFTKKVIGICEKKTPDEYVHYFRGTKNQKTSEDEDGDFSIVLLDIDKVSNLRLETSIGSVTLLSDYEGKSKKIAALTNLYLEQMNLFIRHFENIKNGNDIDFGLNVKEEEDEEELYCPICKTMYPDPAKKVCPKCTNKRTIFGRVLKYFFKYKISIFILALTYITSAVISIAWPYLNGKVLFDHVLKKDNKFLAKYGLKGEYTLALLVVTLMLIGCRLISEISNMVQMAVMAKISTATVRDIKTDVFNSMSKLSLNFFTSKQTGGLMTRVSSDSLTVTMLFIDCIPSIIVQGLTIIVTFVVMYRLNWKMALITCILLPLLVFMTIKLRPGLWSLSGKRHRAEKSVSSRANDNLVGARVVKSFGQEDAEIERFIKPNENLKDAEINIVKLRNRFTILYNMVQEISSIWVWMLGVFFVLKTNEIELGVLITFVGYVGQLNGPMNFFSRVFRMWSESINAAQRLFEIIDSIPDIREGANAISLDNPRGEIELSDVTFGYSVTKPVLKNINLKVKEGEMLGIVGRSGAGKSTLVNLISRLYDVEKGSIKIDGVDVKKLALKDLRKNVAMVSQDTYIFMGSVAKNIAYGNEDASMEDIIRAAKLASAHDFISKMPDGYDTIIGASGKSLSGGEKQRISIARAILANPKILILDEATASVDTQTEKAIQNSLKILTKGRTTLSIAHRLSTLRDADRLIVIDDGCIVEEGTHDELYSNEDGIFYKLSELQNKSLANVEL